jgi:hypothetical protein
MFNCEQNTAAVDGHPQKLNRTLALEKFSPVGRVPDPFIWDSIYDDI